MNTLLSASLRRSIASLAIGLAFFPLAAMAIQIQVELPGGGVLDLTVDPSDTVDSVKDQIQSSEGHLTIFQTLTLNSVELENGFLLSDYSVQDGDILTLAVDDPFAFDFDFDFTVFLEIGNQFFLLSEEVLGLQNSLARNPSMKVYRRGLAKVTRRLDAMIDRLASIGVPKSEMLVYRRSVLEALRSLRPSGSTKPSRGKPNVKVPRPPRFPLVRPG